MHSTGNTLVRSIGSTLIATLIRDVPDTRWKLVRAIKQGGTGIPRIRITGKNKRLI
jgi:hypothetical protein